jgi:hypothetical protein
MKMHQSIAASETASMIQASRKLTASAPRSAKSAPRVVLSILTILAALSIAACPPAEQPQNPDPGNPSASPETPNPSPTTSPHPDPKTYPLIRKDVNPDEYYGISKCVGNTLFVSDQNYGLVIFDVTTPDAPRRVSTYSNLAQSQDGRPTDFAVTGNYLYYTSLYDGTIILDISDIQKPKFAASIPNLSGNLLGIEIAGHYAYLTNSVLGLLIYDIDRPEAPVFLGRSDVPSNERAFDLALSGNRAILLSRPEGAGPSTFTIRTIDISDKTLPKVIASFTESGTNMYGLLLSGSALYAWGSLGLVAMNAADPASIRTTDSVNFAYSDGEVSGAVASGNVLYIGTHANLYYADVSDPSNITISGQINNIRSYGLASTSTRIFAMVRDTAAINVIDISVPGSPSQTGGYDLFSQSMSMAINGSYAYIANYRGGLVTCDVSVPANASVVNQLKSGLPLAEDVAVNGNYAYLAGYNAFCVLDIHIPSTPFLLGSLNETGTSLALSGDYAYLGANGKLMVISTANKAAPVKVAQFNSSCDFSQGIAIKGNTLIGCGVSGYTIIDISAPASPRLLYASSSASQTSSPLFYKDKYLYIVFPNEHLYRIFDVTDPSAPLKIYEQPGSVNAYNIAIRGEKLYTAGYIDDLSVIQEWDISNPLNPTVTARMDGPPGSARIQKCVPTEDCIFALCYTYGLFVYKAE